jgi:hypothetical protein
LNPITRLRSSPLTQAWTTAQTWRLVALAITSLVVVRLHREGVQSYGSDGAEYIEHSARLRVVQQLRDSPGSSSWDVLIGSDHSFPPLLHLLTGKLGELLGHHGAEAAAATGILWLLLLSAALGLLVTEISGRRTVGYAAATGLLLLPAAHGFATRYYYDLPMTALLWSAAAIFLRFRQRAPILGGATAGLLFAAACLTKWPAIPFGIPLLLGALLCRGGEGRERWAARCIALGTCVLTCAGILASFLHGRGDDTSFARMTRVGLDEAPPHVWTTQWDGPVGLIAQGVTSRMGSLEAGDLSFYLLRGFTSVFSPLLAVIVLGLGARWLLRGRLGWRLVLCVVLGHSLFLLGLVPLLDDRFLLTGAPALLIPASLAWSGLTKSGRRVMGAGIVTLGLLMALDFHAAPPMPWSGPIRLAEGNGDDIPCTEARGISAASSVEHRGWSRADSLEWGREAAGDPCTEPRAPARRALRERVWAHVQGCETEAVGLAVEAPLFSYRGDKEWFVYRGELDQVGRGQRAITVREICPTEGHAPFSGPLPPLVLYAGRRGAPACLVAANWEALPAIEDPDGGAPVFLLRLIGTKVCTE